MKYLLFFAAFVILSSCQKWDYYDVPINKPPVKQPASTNPLNWCSEDTLICIGDSFTAGGYLAPGEKAYHTRKSSQKSCIR